MKAEVSLQDLRALSLVLDHLLCVLLRPEILKVIDQELKVGLVSIYHVNEVLFLQLLLCVPQEGVDIGKASITFIQLVLVPQIKELRDLYLELIWSASSQNLQDFEKASLERL